MFNLEPVGRRSDWLFVTSHALLLIEVARTPDVTVRELSDRAGLTERQAHRVLNDLVEAGYLVRIRRGRRNHYRVQTDTPMRHPSLRKHQVGELLDVLA
jgi:DNA-binding MarR family transcriptional regulator